jgi:penicillin amidase
MKALQTNNYDVFAEEARPIFLKNIKETELDADGKKYLELLKTWNLSNEVDAKGATVFNVLWDNFESAIFNDEFKNAPHVVMHPFESSLLEGVLKDSAYKFIDNIETTQKETLPDEVTLAFKNAAAELKQIEANGKLEWAKYKGTRISHLTKLSPFSSPELNIGGGTHCINAAKSDHGPSWRMVVSLTAETEAYGVYPGGQSGNPGSKFYDNFIDYWTKGKYYSLWMMKKEEANSDKVKWKMSFTSSPKGG